MGDQSQIHSGDDDDDDASANKNQLVNEDNSNYRSDDKHVNNDVHIVNISDENYDCTKKIESDHDTYSCVDVKNIVKKIEKRGRPGRAPCIQDEGDHDVKNSFTSKKD